VNAPNHNRFPDLKAATERLFDRELSREDREALSNQLETDPEALQAFRETTNALLQLREPVETPDVTAAVLARLDARPGFTTRRSRHLITTTRLAVAAALLGAGAGVILLQQYPQADPRAMHTSAARQDPDPLWSRLHDPALAAEEIATLDFSAIGESGPGRMPLTASTALHLRPLDLNPSSLEIWSGASGTRDHPLLHHAQPFVLENTWAQELVFDPAALNEPWILPPIIPDDPPWGSAINFDTGSSALHVPGLEFSIPLLGQPSPVDAPAPDEQ